MNIIMLGKPGSGKGTVGKMLSEQLEIIHLSSGELFRSYIKKAGEIGKEIDKYVSQGKLVPDDLAIRLVEKRLQEIDCKNGVILDGFPRTVKQAEELDKFFKQIYNTEFKKPKQEGICDKCGSKLIKRQDDTMETVQQRLKTYYETSAKLIDYYKAQDLLYAVKLNIHSGKTSEDVAKEVKEYLKK